MGNLQFRRGTASQLSGITPLAGEPIFTTDTNGLFIGDGTTAGGIAVGGGTVNSVAFSGGTTGLSVTGSPITSSGTITLAGTLGIANGGTGQTTASGAINALLPTQTGNSGKFLTTNGTAASWATVPSGGYPKQLGYMGF
jgi:hypothetical protein